MESYFVKTVKNIMPSPCDRYVCIGERNECSIFKDDGALALLWKEWMLIPEDVSALRLIPSDSQTRFLPAQNISRFNNLIFLQIPFSIFAKTPIECLPKNIETLMLSNSCNTPPDNYNIVGLNKL
ncbi:TPA: hypothetical protein R5S02_004703, partial [Salmonella enterica]|nr:hypothetical protein [Salmonella enterica]